MKQTLWHDHMALQMTGAGGCCRQQVVRELKKPGKSQFNLAGTREHRLVVVIWIAWRLGDCSDAIKSEHINVPEMET